MYLDANNLYGWGISQKLPVNGFKWNKHVSIFDKDFIKNDDEDSNKGYVFEVDAEYPKLLLNLHNVIDLPFLSQKMKIKKCNKIVFNIDDKENYVLLKKALKQALNNELKLAKVQRVNHFNQKTWFKPYI